MYYSLHFWKINSYIFIKSTLNVIEKYFKDLILTSKYIFILIYNFT